MLDFGKCFVNHPYEMTLELMNDSDLPAKYELISQVRLHVLSGYLSMLCLLVKNDLLWLCPYERDSMSHARHSPLSNYKHIEYNAVIEICTV